jgi:glycosyltransferase involved in cell wall biosynthesis
VQNLLQIHFEQSYVIDRVIVSNNGSTDRTAEVALDAGACVVDEPHRGYGAACLAAVTLIENELPTDIVLFLNADQSEDISEMFSLLGPIAAGSQDLVIGSRLSELREAGALSPFQSLGNNLVSALVRWFWKFPCTDFGPFRAVAWDALRKLRMQDRNYGWTVEMQVKALFHGMRVLEVSVSAKRGKTDSRIGGTTRGVIGAAIKMLGWVIYIASLGVYRTLHDKITHRFLIIQRQIIS